MARAHHGGMNTLLRLWRSTVGRKALVAASGLLLWLWVVLHVAGNLTVYSGPEAADGYAVALRRLPAALWAVRAGLAAAAVVHVAGVVSLTRADRAARPRRQARAGRRAAGGVESWAVTYSTGSGRRRGAWASGRKARAGVAARRWRRCPRPSRWDSRRCRWPCSRGGCDDGARSARSVRPARDPVDAASRRAGAGGADAPAVPHRAGDRRRARGRLRGGDAVR